MSARLKVLSRNVGTKTVTIGWTEDGGDSPKNLKADTSEKIGPGVWRASVGARFKSLESLFRALGWRRPQ